MSVGMEYLKGSLEYQHITDVEPIIIDMNGVMWFFDQLITSFSINFDLIYEEGKNPFKVFRGAIELQKKFFPQVKELDELVTLQLPSTGYEYQPHYVNLVEILRSLCQEPLAENPLEDERSMTIVRAVQNLIKHPVSLFHGVSKKDLNSPWYYMIKTWPSQVVQDVLGDAALAHPDFYAELIRSRQPSLSGFEYGVLANGTGFNTFFSHNYNPVLRLTVPPSFTQQAQLALCQQPEHNTTFLELIKLNALAQQPDCEKLIAAENVNKLSQSWTTAETILFSILVTVFVWLLLTSIVQRFSKKPKKPLRGKRRAPNRSIIAAPKPPPSSDNRQRVSKPKQAKPVAEHSPGRAFPVSSTYVAPSRQEMPAVDENLAMLEELEGKFEELRYAADIDLLRDKRTRVTGCERIVGVEGCKAFNGQVESMKTRLEAKIRELTVLNRQRREWVKKIKRYKKDFTLRDPRDFAQKANTFLTQPTSVNALLDKAKNLISEHAKLKDRQQKNKVDREAREKVVAEDAVASDLDLDDIMNEARITLGLGC